MSIALLGSDQPQQINATREQAGRGNVQPVSKAIASLRRKDLSFSTSFLNHCRATGYFIHYYNAQLEQDGYFTT